jgi:dienelactone hydrolase
MRMGSVVSRAGRPKAVLVAVLLLGAHAVGSPGLGGGLPAVGASLAEAVETTTLATDLAPWWDCLTGAREAFAVQGSVRLRSSPAGAGDGDTIDLRFERFDSESFDLVLEHRDHAATVRRRSDATALALPKHGLVHLGTGATDPHDHLEAAGLTTRLVSPDSLVAIALPMLAHATPDPLLGLLATTLGLQPDHDGTWRAGDVEVRLDDEHATLDLRGPGFDATLRLTASGTPRAAADWPGLERRNVPRAELERTLVRGVRRGLEILAPGPALVMPDEEERSVPHGTLRWKGGQRLVTLHGTPEQIGEAHGRLLRVEAWRCLDSVLHVVGTVETIRDGRWFRSRLDEARERLAPHIPQRHRRELHALAAALDCEPRLLETVNVFPELFHCSGFAVMGSATVDGTLYHGRVLDYMTRIGLQDAATTFVVAATEAIPFVNVGYAGFTGSVSGMNERGISLGEMGGRGEGDWDGVPMATLMRRALEECGTLDEVIDLWRRSPRTCEYYYVFADGRQRKAVGVAATPESLELVWPGEPHPRLGPGIPDAVVLSAGERLECLRQRITEGHGRIDEAAALRLMARPVAMTSNLHNVLFVPEQLRLHVAHASHTAPAADEPAVILDLRELLAAIPPPARAAASLRLPAPGATFAATDSLAPGDEPRDDARDCLAGLTWTCAPFTVRIEPPGGAPPDAKGDRIVRFPSPRPGGVAVNDDVSLEWYAARDGAGEIVRAPACIVVHESGSGMPFGRMIARGLAARGVHAFMVHLPYYGLRRPADMKPAPAALIRAVPQGVADVRRARDAIAALPLVDASRIGVQGTSLGGFVTATAAALDRGFSAAIVVLAGGDIAGVVTNGRRDAAKLRERLTAAGMAEDEIREVFRAVEPLRLAHRLDPCRTWLYSARYDEVVPPRHAALFATAAGLPADHHVQLHANHYTGVIYLPLVLARIRSHLVDGE